MKIARKFGEEFWDGDRRYGYGVINMMEDKNKLLKN